MRRGQGQDRRFGGPVRYLLQRPLPDELLSSVWVRTARRAGLPIGTVTRALTNGRKWSPSFFQVGHLSDLAPLLGAEPLKLLCDHTVFPYATAFFEPAVFDKALAAALATGAAAVGMGAVTQSVSDQARFRRFCPMCAREDRRRYGESYWHRAHSLPGVLLCLEHGRVLRSTTVPTSGTKAWSYALPHELDGERLTQGRDRDRGGVAFDAELARRSVALLSRTLEAQAGRQPVWYRDALLRQGLLSQARQVNAQRLTAWVTALVCGSATRLGFAEKDASLEWIGLMVRPRAGIPFVPLKHLVFETALAVAGSVATAGVDSAATQGGSRQEGLRLLDHVPSGPSGRVTSKRDLDYAAAVTTVVRGYIKRGERVRICDALAEAGCWGAFRHGPERFPRVQKAVQALRRSAASMRLLRFTR